MKVTLNGESREVAPETSVAALLEAHDVPREHTAVELNGELLDRAEHDRVLANGDRLEVVRFVGGG